MCAETVFRGPVYSAGALLDTRIEPMDGPSLFYQAVGFPDVRFSPTKKDGLYPGRVQSFLPSPMVVCADNIPQAVSATGLAAAANPVGGTPMTLVTVQANGSASGVPTYSPGITIKNRLTGALVVTNALDFGFATVTTVAATNTAVANDATLFYLGQWVAIGGAGNSGKTAPLICQVTGIVVSTNTLTFSGGPLNGFAAAAVTNAPVGNMDPPGPIGPNNPWPLSGSPQAPVAAYPYLVRGLGLFLNPPEALARCVSITGVSSGAAQNFTVRGFDVFGFPMTEIIAFVGGAATTYGAKAFKYVTSVTPASNDAHNISVGWGDTFGLHIRSDKWEYTDMNYDGAYVASSTGWLAAATATATGTTGDVRGTVQVGADGAGTEITGGASTNGSIRLTIGVSPALYNDTFGNPVNPVPMFGQPQFAG